MNMTMEQLVIVATIAVYLIAMVLVGVRYSGKSSGGAGEFYLGGRKLGPVVTAMSAEASDMSSWLLMGLPGVAYFTGVADAAWTAIGLAIGTYINWLIVAKRLRIYSAHIEAITLPKFLSKRFEDNSRFLLAIGALIILIFFIPYTASGFAAIGKLFNSLFGFDYLTTMLIGAAVVAIYTILGGFLAVSTTDLIQSIVMSVALVVVLAFGISVEVAPRVLMVPGEGIVQAIAAVTGWRFGNVKVGFDAALVATALVLSLLFFHRLQGLGAGTILSALAVGRFVNLYNRRLPLISRISALAS